MKPENIADAIDRALKKHTRNGVIDMIDMGKRTALIASLAGVIMDQAMRVLEEISRPHSLLTMSHKHFMIKGPECLGDKEREEKCAACPSRKLCDVVSGWFEEKK